MTFNIKKMLKPEVYDHPAESIELIETHISWVILTGEFAYKIKKPVNFGFLNFSTLEKRHEYCKQELILNRRLAPEIYLEVVTISGTQDRPRVSRDGKVIEYAVKMIQFPQSAQLDNKLAANELDIKHMDDIANMVANFHQVTDVSDDSMDYGRSAMVMKPVIENFTQIKQHLDTASYEDKLALLNQWCTSRYDNLEEIFDRRKHDGFIRQCHGDMHLRNMVWLNNKPMAFDCIEFNPDLRWIDVISEIAFLVMDLQDRNQSQLANHFLNAYLEVTGDYDGLSILPFYLCYRAMVRAKVNALRLEQKESTSQEHNKNKKEFESYLELAVSYTRQVKPKLIIMRGMSASGKSTISQQLVDAIGAIRIRSDVERKRIFNYQAKEDATNEVDKGIYTSQASLQTYARLLELSAQIIRSGYSVIVDAAFLKHEQRAPFEILAEKLAVPYSIMEITAPADVLRQRIIKRTHDVSDADLAVLEHQLSNWQALLDSERTSVITINTTEPLDINELVDKFNTSKHT